MNKIKIFLQEKEYARFFLMFFSGTLIAQIITVALSPVLTRIYSPSEFGLYGTYIAVVIVLGVFITGRYEYAINSALEREAYVLFRLINILSMSTAALIFILILFFGDVMINLLNISINKEMLYFVPLTLIMIGFLQATTYSLNRKKKFNILSGSKILQALVNGVSSIIMGLSRFNIFGLIIANILGVFSSQLFQRKNIKKESKVSFKELKEVLIKYKKYPLYNAPSAFFDNLALQAPVLIFIQFFTESIVGFFTLTVRVLGMPLSLISTSISQVFLSQISELHRNRERYYYIIRKTAIGLALIGLIPLAIILFSGPYLFSLVFGSEWSAAGFYSQILIFGHYVKFIVSPLSVVFFINGRVKLLSILQTSRAFLAITILIVMSISFSFRDTLIVYTVFEVVFYGIYYVFIRSATLNYEKSLASDE